MPGTGHLGGGAGRLEILGHSLFACYVYMCFASIYVCALCVIHRGWKNVSYLLGLEVQMVVGHYAGAENRKWVPWKSSQCSDLLFLFAFLQGKPTSLET